MTQATVDESKAFRNALGLFPTGVTVITTVGDDGRKVAGAAQKRTRHGLLVEGYVWRPFLPGCDWVRFEKDFPIALGKALQSPPVAVSEPIYDQHDHEQTWARFNSTDWNQRI